MAGSPLHPTRTWQCPGATRHRRRSTARKRDSKRSKVARQSERKAHQVAPNVHPPIERPAVALPPDLAAARQAIELIRKGEWKAATALATTVGDPVAPKIVEWALLRRSDSAADSSATSPSCRPIPIGPASRYCAGAPRPSCGGSNATAQRCAALSATNRAARLADLRSRAC